MRVNNYTVNIDAMGQPVLCEQGHFVADGRMSYNNPKALYSFFASIGFRDSASEHVYMVALDGQNRVIGCALVSTGAFNASMFPIRDIMQKALLLNATSIALCHNHPSGSLKPSGDDVRSTTRLKEACDLVGIGLIDHIIIVPHSSEYASLYEEGVLRG